MLKNFEIIVLHFQDRSKSINCMFVIYLLVSSCHPPPPPPPQQFCDIGDASRGSLSSYAYTTAHNILPSAAKTTSSARVTRGQ